MPFGAVTCHQDIPRGTGGKILTPSYHQRNPQLQSGKKNDAPEDLPYDTLEVWERRSVVKVWETRAPHDAVHLCLRLLQDVGVHHELEDAHEERRERLVWWPGQSEDQCC